ncbi:MAG: DUF5615 family PIN-like protein [Candidatus Methylomirabilia bacterium]
MKLLLDQGLPRSAAGLLSQAGIDSLHVGDLGHSDAADEMILDLGREAGRTVVTLDADFHALLALKGAVSPSVIRLRIEGLRAEELATLVKDVVQSCSEDLARGAAVTVQEGRLRIRHLPLIGDGLAKNPTGTP